MADNTPVKLTPRQRSFLSSMADKADKGALFWGQSISSGFVGAGPVRAFLRKNGLVTLTRVSTVDGSGKPIKGSWSQHAEINEKGLAALASE